MPAAPTHRAVTSGPSTCSLRDVRDLAGIPPFDISRRDLHAAEERRRQRDPAIDLDRRRRDRRRHIGEMQRRVDGAVDVADERLPSEKTAGLS